jgi:predicted ArsR family transcriptional regulator
MQAHPPDPISAVAALDEPTRRQLYDYVARARGPVSRDEASAATGISRPTVAFHLDRLADEGLLDVVHRRLGGRSGPGAGRPSKLYLRTPREVEVSLPARRYELAGELLAAALEEAQASGRSAREALATTAYAAGHGLGREAAGAAGACDPVPVLEAQGFEPHADEPVVTLGNCPFHHLAQAHTELVCGMNLHLLEGLVDGLGCSAYEAALAPSAGHCCVVLRPR